MRRLILTLTCLFLLSKAAENNPFYANRESADSLVSKIRFNEYQGPGKDPHPEIDANEILGSFMNPFMEMYDSMQQNYKARQYAEKVQRERDENLLSNSQSIFDIIEKMKRPTTTTTPQPPLIERLLKPYIEPWQKQMDYLSQDMIGLIRPTTTTTTTTQAPVTPKKSILERTLAAFFPSLRKQKVPEVAATPNTQWFDPAYLENALFRREKRNTGEQIKRQTQLSNFLPADLEKPKPLEVTNPFTPNPLMAMFIMKPIPELKINSIEAKPINDPFTQQVVQPTFKLQDPFYNPLFPNRRSKLFDLLAGGEAARILG